MTMQKAILLNAMYSGTYLNTHLGHEAINLFEADNGKHYIYINPVGKIAQDYDVECILLGELVKDGVFKVIAKATGLKMLESTKAITKETGAKSSDPLPEHLKALHLKELEGVTYANNVPLASLFGEEVHVLATFEAEKVVMAKKSTYIYTSNYPTDDKNRLPEAIHSGDKPFKFAKTSPYMYFPEGLADYGALKEIINNTKWEAKSVDKLEITGLDTLEPITSVEMMRKETDELAYSNMIWYWLNKDTSYLKRFVCDLLKEKNQSIPEPSDDIIIEREHNNIDILISYGSTRIIIENKIEATISTYEDKEYPNQLTKYKEELKKEPGVKDVHCFVLMPDYRSDLKTGDYDKDYLELKYSDLVTYFNKVPYGKNVPATKITITQFEDFVRTLQLHSGDSSNLNYRKLIRILDNTIQNRRRNPIVFETKESETIKDNGTLKRFRVELQLKGTSFMEFRKLDDATYKKLKMKKIKTTEDAFDLVNKLQLEDFAMTYGISDNMIPEDFKLTVYDVTGLNEDETASSNWKEVFQTDDVDLIFNKFDKIRSNTKPDEEIEDGPCFMAGKYLLIEQYCDMMLFQFHIEDTKFDINQLEFQRMDNFNGLLCSNWSDPWNITYRGHYVRDVEDAEDWDCNLDDPRYKIIEKGDQDYGWEIEKEFENQVNY